MSPRRCCALCLLLLLAACDLSGSPAATPVPTTLPTGGPTSSPTAVPATSAEGPCEIVAGEDLPVYMRPSLEADLFGTMAAGWRIDAAARTADGWLGFEPGVAQAPNVGPFRLRWVLEGSGVHLEGDCAGLPEVVGPPVGVCFSMTQQEIPVYADPDPSSEPLVTMIAGDYAAVIGRWGDGWVQLDLSIGTVGLDRQGWIEASLVNFNGPCDDLPAVEP